MKESKLNEDERLDKIKSWKKTRYDQLKEGEIVRMMDVLDSSEKNNDQFGELQAMAAVARFHRKKEWDRRIDDWLTRAMNVSSSDYISKVVVYIALETMNESWFQEDFPKIRETDHSQGKKKKIDQMLMMLQKGKGWQQELQARKIQINEAIGLREDDEARFLTKGLDLINDIGQEIDELVEAATHYRKTISGIYSSKDKKQLMEEKTKQLQHQLDKWEIWRETIGTESESDALDELNTMVGLDEVKNKVETYFYYLQYQRERQRQGYHFESERNLNMILTGNPGTGKTTIVRLLARIYHQLGALPRENVVEVDRSHLVGAYVGQTEEKTMNVIQEAVGGVLFIDEAYSLRREGASGSDYGQTAIDTLVSAMTSGEYAGKFSVVLAGYTEEMRTFLWSNPGLRSRFPETNHIHLPDFSMDELVEIAEHVALDNDYSLTDEAIKQLRKKIHKERIDESFGNARTVKNLVLEAIFQKGAKAAQEKDYSKNSLTVLDENAFMMNDQKSEDESQAGEEKLNHLIGLKNVKEEVRQLSSFVKIQKQREKNGLPSIPIQLHAVFSGPPGTGKTTVAHIYSQILYELDLLKRGHVVITGRSDLVAGYVGQTAIKTKQKIREALGGVLFIDEAYSLLSKGEQDFGREAIDTLVEEMTKHEENLVVILAGYSDLINSLLESNPGLSSRFKKSIVFPHYSVSELMEIINLYVNEFGYEMESDVTNALFEKITNDPPAGNARSMKDMVEEAIQRQAYRLVYEQNQDDLSILTKEDFSIFEEER
ncbi:AAA family ATPase [Salipaludibacillus daqingensis]|uniref:AAA family ATPase n=1 Tax=Salipaludibacillus daqingensis TaxID=3041001 RepID=UPI002474E42F|nr:AAA family ATPase [Salipaludibacillus daqingensis]